MKQTETGKQVNKFLEIKWVAKTLVDSYASIDGLLVDFPAYPVWLESAIRWSEKLQWETELELQFELWQLSDNLLFAFIANKRFSTE